MEVYQNKYDESINLDNIFGEINTIGQKLELWGLEYNHMYTNIYRIGLRLQELSMYYKQMKKDEKVS